MPNQKQQDARKALNIKEFMKYGLLAILGVMLALNVRADSTPLSGLTNTSYIIETNNNSAGGTNFFQGSGEVYVRAVNIGTNAVILSGGARVATNGAVFIGDIVYPGGSITWNNHTWRTNSLLSGMTTNGSRGTFMLQRAW